MSESMRQDDQPDDPRRQAERWELLGHLQAIAEPLMVVLGIAFLVLLLVDYGGFLSGSPREVLLSRTLTGIWVIFLVEFTVRLAIAPARLRFLKANWLSALSLALPFLRPFRALRAVRALRSISLVRLLGGVNRAMRVLRRISNGHQIAYIVGLTTFVCLAGAAGVWYFDGGVEESPIESFGDALWWSAALVTTINNEKYAVSGEARVIAILLRVFAISVFGYITATIASYLLGQHVVETSTDEGNPVRDELIALRLEVSALRHELSIAGIGKARHRPDAPNLIDSGIDDGGT
ncbi:MAG: ion transporter [Chloroflexota bacterium]|nr:ion transporter [Chloroflexota bacterium]